MAKIQMPYIAWRDGRPRFVPGARERAMGFKGRDLKHDGGRWFTMDEAAAFAMAKQQEIHAQRKTGRKLKTPPVPRGRAVQDLWDAYIGSDKFKGNPAKKIRGLSPSSQKSYKNWIKPLQSEPVWIAPVAALDPTVLKAVHGKILSERGLAMANATMRALSAALVWGRLHNWLPKVNGQVVGNPASKLDMPSEEPRLRVASDKEIVALVAASDCLLLNGKPMSAIGDAVLTGLFSGQRRKDVLEFVLGEVNTNRIELLQSKTGARVSIPMAPRLIERIAAGKERRTRANYRVVLGNIVINEGTGRSYTGNTFWEHFDMVRAAAVEGIADDVATAKARAAHAASFRNDEPPTVWKVAPCASLATFTFPDLRDTAVTWYARAGCTIPEIASITGHSLKTIYDILKHYLALDAHLADNAVKKLVAYMEREGLAV